MIVFIQNISVQFVRKYRKFSEVTILHPLQFGGVFCTEE